MSPDQKPTPVRIELPRQSQIFFYVLIVLMLFLTWLVFRPFVIYMITGVFVAVLALPIDKRLDKIVPNRLSAVATILVLLVIVTAPLLLVGIALFSDVQGAAQSLREGGGQEFVGGMLDLFMPDQSPEERNETIQQIWGWAQPRLQGVLDALADRLVRFVGEFFIAVTVILFVVYYVLTDGERLVQYVRRAAPLPSRQVDFLLGEAHRGLQAVFVGQILTSAIQGILGGIGFLVAGVPGAVLWAVVMAILSLLPVVGAFLVWIPAVIYLLLLGHIWQAIFLALWGFFVVSNIDNFLRPRLIGNRAGIHPLFILIGVLGGVAAFGFIGLFLGPLLVGVTISVLRVWESEYLDPRVGRDDPTRPEPGTKASDAPAGPEKEAPAAEAPPEDETAASPPEDDALVDFEAVDLESVKDEDEPKDEPSPDR